MEGVGETGEEEQGDAIGEDENENYSTKGATPHDPNYQDQAKDCQGNTYQTRLQ